MTISPHLITPCERIQLNGQPVDTDLYAEAEQVVNAADSDQSLSYFERHIVMAFWTFAQQKVNWAIIETGVGGRLDATNVLPKPAVCAITSIGLDHQEWLGLTLDAIAGEKAGIIKPGVPVVLGPSIAPALSKIFQQFAQSTQSALVKALPLQHVDKNCWKDTHNRLWTIPLTGEYQGDNLATALAVLQTLHARGYPVGQPQQWQMGLRQACWPARFQISEDRRLIIDGSHNADGLQAMAIALRHWYTPDKQVSLMLSLKANRCVSVLKPVLEALPWQNVWTTQGPDADYHPASNLIPEMPGLEAMPDLTEAWQAAQCWQATHLQKWVVITGSLYTAGQILLSLRNLASSTIDKQC